MKPDFEDEGVALYCQDCLEVLPNLGTIDCIITDPPYGIGRDGSNESTGSHGGRKAYEFRGWDEAPPCGDIFRQIFSSSRDQVIWGANYFPMHLPSKMGWIVWDKGQDICGSDCELAFTSRDTALRRKVINRVDIAKDGAVHPTQKPIRLMTWCISFFPNAKTICDPFMGSASTGISCIRTGRRFIGIERDPTHFKTAVDRIKRELAQGNLFPAAALNAPQPEPTLL